MNKGKLEKMNPKDPSNLRTVNSKGHGAVMAGKAKVRKNIKACRTK
jgi:hypothetical protein